MANYKQFSYKQFEYKLRGICIENKLGFMEDITDEWNKDHETWERIYKISTKNRAVDIIIFSSVSINQNKVRPVGADAVRVVMRWKTQKYGFIYKRIGKHYRVETLFDNLKRTLQGLTPFDLKAGEFTVDIKNVD